MHHIRTALGIVFTLGLIVFCVFNRHPAALYWSPVHEPKEIPLYAIITGAALFGFFWGALSVFLSHHKIRKDRHDQKKHIRLLEKELHASQSPVIPGVIEVQSLPTQQTR